MASKTKNSPVGAGKKDSLRGGKMSKVVVQHRSDMLMEEQVGQVKQVQKDILKSLEELTATKSNNDAQRLREKMEHLQQQAEEKVFLLKIVHKLNVELVYARDELQKALKSGGDVNRARKRVGWLEDRMEILLGRRRVRSPARSLPQTPKTPLKTDETLESEISAIGISNVKNSTLDDQDQRSPSCSPPREDPKEKLKESEKIPPNMGDGDAPSLIVHKLNVEGTTQIDIQPPASDSDDQSYSKVESQQSASEAGDTLLDPDDVETKAASSEDALTLADSNEDESEEINKDRETTSITKSPTATQSKIRKASRVTLKTPSETGEMPDISAKSHAPTVEKYWNSEHHRFEYSEFKDSLLQMNPMSYHRMGLAVPGSFIEQKNYDAKLPWRPPEKSEITDVHKIALDKLALRLEMFHEKLSEATALSTGLTSAPSKSKKSNFEDLSLHQKPSSLPNQPTMAKYVEFAHPASEQSITFPTLMKERLGSSLSGRLIYYPNPLSYPENLPVTRTKRSKIFPKSSENYSQSVPGKVGPAERIVDQRNLYNETKFTSSLYRSNTAVRNSASASEKHFQKLLKEDSTATSSTVSRKRGLKGRVNAVTGVLKFKEEPTLLDSIQSAEEEGQSESEWSLMKPISGAIEHSGLKWERVKSIVHDSLISPNLDERAHAAKHLGMLQCGDTLVMYALKERLKHDDHDRVKYEAAKALILLGCWEEIVVEAMLFYLIKGNSDMREDILKTMINGKNVQFVDKAMNVFPDLVEALSLLCESDDAEDTLALNSSVLLGKLCVHDENAIRFLRYVIKDSKKTHTLSEAVESLVRQLACHEWDVVEAVLHQIVASPVWKHRLNAAKLLVVIGKKSICTDDHQEYVYNLLERRLWDDPNKSVRLEVAKAMAALELFAQACEQAEKQLEDSSEDIRAQAVITLGTLGMKAERIIKSLLEMLDLDPSEYVRLMILRTIAQLSIQDKRIVRALRDKERGEGPLALEARKTMEVLGVESLHSISSKVASNKKLTSAVSFSLMATKS